MVMEMSSGFNSTNGSQTPLSYKDEMTSYFWTNKMASIPFRGGAAGKASSSQYIMPFVRHNRDYRDKKNLQIYVNDSSHKNPSDPNTMMDQG
jgi:hypothetical protein